MQLNFLIIDDFLENAGELREAALSLTYPQPISKTYFPGRNSEKRIMLQGIDETIEEIVCEPLTPTEGFSHCKPRLALKGEKGEGNIHIDKSYWSGILYLTKNEHCTGGTDFFRHIPTNTEHAPLDKAELSSMGFNHYQEFWDDLMLKDTNDKTKWQKTFHVPMKFNRLVLFRPWFYHNAGESFGDKPQNGRLIYPLFYSLRK
ncbi:MAG: hypothetical protein COA74_13585 [Gammaproteobacteria bacterium]|nr:MAG: hypothetical protein COA74_13585 [Gammaproteobacteria bacterium]